MKKSIEEYIFCPDKIDFWIESSFHTCKLKVIRKIKGFKNSKPGL